MTSASIKTTAKLTKVSDSCDMWKIELTATDAEHMPVDIFVSEYIPIMYSGGTPHTVFHHTLYKVEEFEIPTEPENRFKPALIRSSTATLCVKTKEAAIQCWKEIQEDIKRLIGEYRCRVLLYENWTESSDTPGTIIFHEWTREMTEDSIIFDSWCDCEVV